MLHTIADLHLSLSTQKPMDIFSGWENHTERIKSSWVNKVGNEDIVVIPGDISWAMNLKEALPDFKLINSMPGKKYILKGNHDYWWESLTKMKKWIKDNNLDTIDFIFNNCAFYNDIALCGTRGWMVEEGVPHDDLLIAREEGRLKRSLEMAEDKEKIVFLHYPPIWGDQAYGKMLDIMLEHNVKECYYGHIHGPAINYAPNGNFYGINFKLISADALKFNVDTIR